METIYKRPAWRDAAMTEKQKQLLGDFSRYLPVGIRVQCFTRGQAADLLRQLRKMHETF